MMGQVSETQNWNVSSVGYSYEDLSFNISVTSFYVEKLRVNKPNDWSLPICALFRLFSSL